MARRVTLPALLLALACTMGSASTPGGGSAALLRECSQQVEASLAAIALRSMSGDDLKRLYTDFEGEVRDLDSIAQRVRATNHAMRSAGQKYFDSWEAEIAKINNEDIRSQSQQRKAEVEKRRAEIGTGFDDLATDDKAFVSDLNDIDAAVQMDLTADGVRAVGGAMLKADKHGRAVKASIDRMAAVYEALGLRLGGAMD